MYISVLAPKLKESREKALLIRALVLWAAPPEHRAPAGTACDRKPNQ
ncbi:MAG: hypothetical protein KME57_18340 [Scytonema hyalinum WJT4-NPBG1]|nr:hypothetical protein [Scytonema hyalinum WJT4-NPBG1]